MIVAGGWDWTGLGEGEGAGCGVRWLRSGRVVGVAKGRGRVRVEELRIGLEDVVEAEVYLMVEGDG